MMLTLNASAQTLCAFMIDCNIILLLQLIKVKGVYSC